MDPRPDRFTPSSSFLPSDKRVSNLPGIPLPPIDIPIARHRRGGVALVLSGGGAKGCFQAGAVETLWSRGFRPDIICGVSVGALNAAKLAEGETDSATLLRSIWEGIAVGTYRVYDNNAALEAVIDGTIRDIRRRLDITGDITVLGRLKEEVLAAVHGGLSGLHALHSVGHSGFEGLIGLINRFLNPEKIARSGIRLRIGMVDLEQGGMWHVTEPQIGLSQGYRDETHYPGQIFYRDARGLLETREVSYGLLEREPDLLDDQPTWPGSTPNLLMSLYEAIYASCAMPVYFPPIRSVLFPVFGDDNCRIIKGELPLGHRSLFPAREPYAIPYMPGPTWRHFFDGGLRDILPIRTAMRLGAREIYVVTGSRLHRGSEWSFREGRVDHIPDDIPAVQYLNGFLSAWGGDVMRNDMFTAVAFNEFLGWLYRMYSLLDSDQRRQIQDEFNYYWARRGPDTGHGSWLRTWLASSTWLGGDAPFDSRYSHAPHGSSPYGSPFGDEACSIKLIAPRERVTGVLDFSRENILAGIESGRRAAESPVEISLPVPNDLIVE